MAIQFKRAQSNVRTNYTPAEGELYIVDPQSSNPLIYIGDGSTAGGKLTGSIETNAFATISVSGQNDIVAESVTDTVTFVAGSNITLTTDAVNDSITMTPTLFGGTSKNTNNQQVGMTGALLQTTFKF